jgi:hypothetical protein
MISLKRSLSPLVKPNQLNMYNLKRSFKYLFASVICLILISGCKANLAVSRADFIEDLPRICKTKYQAHVTCKEAGDTVWVYLPYTASRSGIGVAREDGKNIFIDYSIASFNPYRVLDPPELKFLSQKILSEIRALLLKSTDPYQYFVLVICDITVKKAGRDQLYIGRIDDVKNYGVGKDFSGEGYNRLTWALEDVGARKDDKGEDVALSYQDKEGSHVNYRDISLREFVAKQIGWRIYKQFTIEYSKVPFDLSVVEKKDAVTYIVQTVLKAYNCKEFENVFMNDADIPQDGIRFVGYPLEKFLKVKAGRITRKPAF